MINISIDYFMVYHSYSYKYMSVNLEPFTIHFFILPSVGMAAMEHYGYGALYK